jgi:DNA invertase Pin-like site-specific DNA recombinase
MSKTTPKTRTAKRAISTPKYRLIGYARVSTLEQVLDLQLDALRHAGCEKIFTDTMSGATAEREGLTKALAALRPGDTLVVWKLDRLGRSLQHLLETVNGLRERGVGFKSLIENMDTTTPSGKFLFHIFAALAEFEREIIRERVNAGLQAARRRGNVGGRPRKVNALTLNTAKTLMKEYGIGHACRTLNLSRSTLYRALAADK